MHFIIGTVQSCIKTRDSNIEATKFIFKMQIESIVKTYDTNYRMKRYFDIFLKKYKLKMKKKLY